MTSSPAPPSMVSPPEPPWIRSAPGPPLMTSGAAAPSMTSPSSPPLIVSWPKPPNSRSAPPPPEMASSPEPPSSRSSPPMPLIRSPPVSPNSRSGPGPPRKRSDPSRPCSSLPPPFADMRSGPGRPMRTRLGGAGSVGSGGATGSPSTVGIDQSVGRAKGTGDEDAVAVAGAATMSAQARTSALRGAMLLQSAGPAAAEAWPPGVLDALDERPRAQPAAAAHGHESDLLVGALELVQQRGDQPRAGRAERMADGHRAAVDVDAVHVRVVLALPCRHDRRERLVDLDQVDVIDRHLVAVEDLRGRRDRALEHLDRVAAHRGLVDDLRAGRQPQLGGLVSAHQEHGGGAVGDLRRIACRDDAILLEDGLELAERLEVGVRPDALVGDVGVAVDLHRDHLALEAALFGRLVGELVRAHGELVELGARDLPLLGDHLGAEALADDVVLGHELGREGVAEVLLGLHAGGERQHPHVLDAPADDDVVDAGGDLRRSEVDRLLGRAALQVDGGRRGLDGQAGLEPRVAAHVQPLRAELLDATRDHVLDLGGIDARALDDRLVRGAEEHVRVRVLVVALLSVATPHGGAGGLDDDDLSALERAHERIL